ncbi:hypothetical protein [Bizionia sp.]|uniref:hypothetical protein n=1 Tax=Bizionia sp. TaxID=1954480 RepID=UPI003A91C78A
MKQTQIANYLKLGILLFGILLIVASCQKDDFTNQSNESSKTESDFKITTLRKDKILEKKSLLTKLEKIETKLKVQSKATSINGREVYSEENGFTINTEYCKEIFDGTKYTYTFPVFRDEDNGLLENLWLIEEADSTYTAYLVQYEFTAEDITALNFRQQINVENKITYIELNADELVGDIFGKYYYNGACYEDLWTYQEGTRCRSTKHTFAQGNECDYWGTTDMATNGGYVLLPTLVPCGDGGGGPSNGGNPPDYNPTNPNSNPNHGGGNQGGSTTPVTCKFCPELEPPIDSNDEGNDPCDNLNNVTNSNDISPDIDFLKVKSHTLQEYAYEIEYKYNSADQAYEYNGIQVTSGQNLTVVVGTGGHIQGQAHNHPTNGQAIPSWIDLNWMLTQENNNSPFHNGNTYNIVVVQDLVDPTKTVSYGVTISDLSALQTEVDFELSQPEIQAETIRENKLDLINKKFGKKFQRVQHDSEAMEKKFLEVYADYGVSLFKMNDDTNNWEELKLQGSEVIPVPCD